MYLGALSQFLSILIILVVLLTNFTKIFIRQLTRLSLDRPLFFLRLLIRIINNLFLFDVLFLDSSSLATVVDQIEVL